MDADWLVFDPHPSKPRLRLPDGAVDTHCHVFGPGAIFPFAPERKYTPCDASKDDLFRLRDFLGVSRNVVVQATCHGSDNAAMLDVLASSPGRSRGVATVRPDISAAELRDMHDLGVRGVRFNYVRRLADPEPDEYYYRIVEKIAPLGWHVVIYFEAADLNDRWDFFTSLETPVVVDHMGRPDVTKSIDGPEFGQFLRLMSENENFWCKVTCPERLVGQRTARLSRHRAFRPPRGGDIPRPRAVGDRLAPPQPQGLHARRRQDRRLYPAGGAHQ